MRLDVFKDKQFNKELIKLALPIAFQSLMLASVAAADAFMLGSVEQDFMSAVSLATQIQFIQNIIVSGFVIAITALDSQYFGKGDYKNVTNVVSIGLKVNAFISIITFIGCLFFPRELMLVFTDNEALIEIGVRYLKIASYSYLLSGVSQSYLALLKVENKAKHVAIISTTTVVINILLNAILIFGLLGVPALNEEGAAIATLISRLIEFIWCIVLSLIPGYLRPTTKSLFTVNKTLYRDFYKCAFPLVGAFIIWGVGFTSYSAFMGHLGPDATAANSLASVVRDMICCLCNGLASGGGIMLGYQLGKGNLDKGKEYGDKLFTLAFVCGFGSTILMLIITPIILPFIKLSGEATTLFIGMMLIMSFYMIGRSFNTIVINGIFDTGGDTTFDLYSLAITMWGLAVPLAFLGTFIFNWHPLVVYAMTCLDEVGKIPWAIAHYKKYKWVKDLTMKTEEVSD